MNYKIALIKGDGIGPEVVGEAVKVMEAVGEKFGHTFTFEDVLMGGCAIDNDGYLMYATGYGHGDAMHVSDLIPELQGRFSGYSLRVPTPTVSVVDFTAIVGKATSAEEVNAALKEAEQTYLKGILGTNELPLVSMDFKGDPRSSIVELEYTAVQEGTLVKAVSWYDNEWGYSNRVCDVCCMMADRGL